MDISSKPDPKQARLQFTAVISGAAMFYGALLAYRLLHFQADAVSDIIKMSGMIFIVTCFVSYVWWTVITAKISGLKGGALAGFLTVITIIPLPTFFGALKGHYAANPDIVAAALTAAQYALSTFSLAEILAIPPSIAVGMWAARGT